MVLLVKKQKNGNGCLLSEMVLSSAETSGKLTALVCVLNLIFFKALNLWLAMFNQLQTEAKTVHFQKVRM